MIFINNSSNFNLGIVNHNDANNEIPLERADLPIHIGTCLNMIPSKQLSRCLRDTFMLHIEALEKTCPDFYGFITELAVLLTRLDDEADQQKS